MALWVAVLVAIMVVIGGSDKVNRFWPFNGEWRPLMGTLPPMTTLEWQRVYQLYQASPEYQQLNYGMSLDAFQNNFLSGNIFTGYGVGYWALFSACH